MGSRPAQGSRLAQATRSAPPTRPASRTARVTEMRPARATRSVPGRGTGWTLRPPRSTAHLRSPARGPRGSRWPAIRCDRRVSESCVGNGRAMGSSLRGSADSLSRGMCRPREARRGNPVGTGQARGAALVFGATPGDRAASGSVRLHVFPRALRELLLHRVGAGHFGNGTGPCRRPRGAGTRHWLAHAREARHARCDRSDARHGATRREIERVRLSAGTSGGGV